MSVRCRATRACSGRWCRHTAALHRTTWSTPSWTVFTGSGLNCHGGGGVGGSVGSRRYETAVDAAGDPPRDRGASPEHLPAMAFSVQMAIRVSVVICRQPTTTHAVNISLITWYCKKTCRRRAECRHDMRPSVHVIVEISHHERQTYCGFVVQRVFQNSYNRSTTSRSILASGLKSTGCTQDCLFVIFVTFFNVTSLWSSTWPLIA